MFAWYQKKNESTDNLGQFSHGGPPLFSCFLPRGDFTTSRPTEPPSFFTFHYLWDNLAVSSLFGGEELVEGHEVRNPGLLQRLGIRLATTYHANLQSG